MAAGRPARGATAVLNTARHFGADRSGSIAMTTAIAALPLMLAIGAGVDYARAVSEKTQLQIGTDAAAIAGIRAVRQGVSVATATTVMTAVIQADDLNPAAHASNATLSTDGTTLCVDSTSQITTAFMAMAGFKTIPVGAHACSAMNIDTFEIAFAIDNSGSMNDSAQNGQTKIAAAKSAANALITALTPAASASAANLTASYSVVPFAASVDVGVANATASWMDTTAASSIHWNNYLRPSGVTLPASRFAMFTNMSTAWGGCVEERPSPYTVSDDASTSARPDTLYVPLLYPDEQDSNSAVYNSYLKDEGGTCVVNDASYKADKTGGTGDGQTKLCKYKAKPTSTNSSSRVNPSANGPNIACTTTAVSPLNATKATTTAAIAAMNPSGDTLLMAGFMWAWRTISPNGPFPGTGGTATSGPQVPKAYNYVNPTTGAANHKVIILLTDGMNHWAGEANDASFASLQNDPNDSIYNALGFFGDNRLGLTTAANARGLLDTATVQACSNAKAIGVEVYTVGFLATDGIDAAGQQTLASCATDSAHTFLAQDGDELVTVFQNIAATLTKPRIAK
ncbi:TadE/TadG family type IV pilus assembly protein [Beijerinckia sp. L45]|uniref:TadE/TadG family type IV pilus assembly protein n=1 Tax=Beijerinckia sp. L45 TaxID=1641855 RepID=UPI00131B915E|nr:TadE/TadG family type IV pilus assembly protein [Beijerinckia sp. L45]